MMASSPGSCSTQQGLSPSVYTTPNERVRPRLDSQIYVTEQNMWKLAWCSTWHCTRLLGMRKPSQAKSSCCCPPPCSLPHRGLQAASPPCFLWPYTTHQLSSTSTSCGSARYVQDVPAPTSQINILSSTATAQSWDQAQVCRFRG